MTVIWAGKRLSVEEEARVRDTVAMFERLAAAGDPEGSWQAESWRRFLPEEAHRWTPEELEFGAHVGPWISFGVELGEPAPE